MRSSTEHLPAETLDRVRSFNRFYTRLLGLFEPRFMGHDLCLTEARVLYEIHRRGSCRARDLLADLDLDRGYLSRLLGTFETRGWVVRDQEVRDRRLRNLSLTPQGEKLALDLESRARQRAEPCVRSRLRATGSGVRRRRGRACSGRFPG